MCKNRPKTFFTSKYLLIFLLSEEKRNVKLFLEQSCLILEEWVAVPLAFLMLGLTISAMSRCLLFGFVSRTDKCALKCRSFLSSSVDFPRKGVIFGSEGFKTLP